MNMKKIIYFSLLLCGFGCREKYDAPVTPLTTGYLVVEGFINNGTTPSVTTVTLSRTTKLTDTAKILYEKKAQVTIEGAAGGSFSLTETTAGVYTSAPLTLNASDKYRIHIKTTAGKDYMSDYSPVKSTPAIDSVNWVRNSDGIQMYINTHNPAGNTRYYQWKAEETWEYHSPTLSRMKWVFSNLKFYNAVFRTPAHDYDSSIYKCWQFANSTGLLLGSSENLSKDLIYLPIWSVPAASWKIGVLYSLNIKQYACSHEAYNFLQLMKKNTEQLGSIFDAQPSQLKGNIHCTSDTTEIVIGFVEVTQEQQKRIFIYNSQLLDWNYDGSCQTPGMGLTNDSSTLNKNIFLTVSRPAPGVVYTSFIPTEPPQNAMYDIFGNPTFIFMAVPECVDCTLRGGITTKPIYWP